MANEAAVAAANQIGVDSDVPYVGFRYEHIKPNQGPLKELRRETRRNEDAGTAMSH